MDKISRNRSPSFNKKAAFGGEGMSENRSPDRTMRVEREPNLGNNSNGDNKGQQRQEMVRATQRVRGWIYLRACIRRKIQ